MEGEPPIVTQGVAKSDKIPYTNNEFINHLNT